MNILLLPINPSVYQINQAIFSLVMFLSTNQEVLDLIPDSAVGLFSRGEIFHGICCLCVSMFFVHFCPVLPSEEVAAL
jgi:hypothetical protein